jgi:hypothetical protein
MQTNSKFELLFRQLLKYQCASNTETGKFLYRLQYPCTTILCLDAGQGWHF